MQTCGVVQGANTIPRRGRLNALLAVAAAVAIAAVVALLIWVVPPVTSGVGVEEAVPAARAGSAIVHDDAGSVHSGAGSAPVANGGYPETYYPLPNGKLASLNAGAGSAVIHDDAGRVNR